MSFDILWAIGYFHNTSGEKTDGLSKVLDIDKISKSE